MSYSGKNKRENLSFNNNFKCISSYGEVNINDIPDRQYAFIEELAIATLTEELPWESESLLLTFKAVLCSVNSELIYHSRFKGMYVEIKYDIKGKISLIVKNGWFKKIIINTFNNFVSIEDIKTSRSKKLYNLFRLVRHQVDYEAMDF